MIFDKLDAKKVYTYAEVMIINADNYAQKLIEKRGVFTVILREMAEKCAFFNMSLEVKYRLQSATYATQGIMDGKD